MYPKKVKQEEDKFATAHWFCFLIIDFFNRVSGNIAIPSFLVGFGDYVYYYDGCVSAEAQCLLEV